MRLSYHNKYLFDTICCYLTDFNKRLSTNLSYMEIKNNKKNDFAQIILKEWYIESKCLKCISCQKKLAYL